MKLKLFFVLLFSCGVFAANKRQPFTYFLGSISDSKVVLPAGKTIPFDWKVNELQATGNEIVIHFNQKINAKNKTIFFRLTSATDIRENCVLQVFLPISKKNIGTIDIRYSHYMQPHQLAIPLDQWNDVAKEGLAVKMIAGVKPFWFFVSDGLKTEIPTSFLPHVLVSDLKINSLIWKERLNSFASLSSFGWMEGIVLDGLQSMGYTKQQEKHFNQYKKNNRLVYEAYNNQRLIDSIFTVEAILPFAFFNYNKINQKYIDKALEFCKKQADSQGVIADDLGINRTLKTEECYTIAFPLAKMAIKLNKPELFTLAIANLRARAALLQTDDFIYQKSTENGTKVFANWARGMGWYLLGLAKTLPLLPESAAKNELKEVFKKGAFLAMHYQDKKGLWNCFIHEPETGIETSGSAVLTAALAYGYSKKMLPKSCKIAAQKGYDGLMSFLTPDGFLTGTAQINKGGESLQRSKYRVISPYTLGFLGIIQSSLSK